MLQRFHRDSESGRRPRSAKAWLVLVFVLALLPLLTVAADPVCQVQQARDAYGVEIVTDGQNWDDASLNAVMDALGRLPAHVVNQLGSRIYGRLYILSTRSRAPCPAQSLLQRRQLLLEQRRPQRARPLPGPGHGTVLHELGHAYQLR